MILGLGAYNFWSWLERWFAKGKMFNFLSFLGLHERVVLVTKDLAPEQILKRPCFRYIQAWFIRSDSDGGAKLGPRRDSQIFMSF